MRYLYPIQVLLPLLVGSFLLLSPQWMQAQESSKTPAIIIQSSAKAYESVNLSIAGDTPGIKIDWGNGTLEDYATISKDPAAPTFVSKTLRQASPSIKVYGQGLSLLGCASAMVEEIEFGPDASTLEYLVASHNTISSLDFSHIPHLRSLNLSDNNLSTIDLSNLTELTFLNLMYNQLESLDISHNPQLTRLYASQNQLRDVSLKGLSNLIELNLTRNELSNISLSDTPLLEELSVTNNRLTSLDLSPLSQLKSLSCSLNQLTSLDISPCPALMILYCSNNQLTKIDLSKNPKLSTINFTDNSWTACDLNATFETLPDVRGGQLNCTVTLLSNEANLDTKGYKAVTTSTTEIATQKGWKIVDDKMNPLTGDGSGCAIQESIKLFTEAKTISFFLTSSLDETIEIDWGEGGEREAIALKAGQQKSLGHQYASMKQPQHSIQIFAKSLTAIQAPFYPSMKLTYFDASGCSTLTRLDLGMGNNLYSIDLSKNTALNYINLSNCGLSLLTLPKDLGQLEELRLSTNDIKKLDLKGAIALKKLSVPSNKLRSIDLSDAINLEFLNLNLNGLEELKGIPPHNKLESLDLGQNNLPFSMIPARGNMSTYVYNQLWYDIPNSLIEELTIDLSAEAQAQGISDKLEPTEFSWFILASNGARIPITADQYTNEGGKFTFKENLFPSEMKGGDKLTIYALMTNPGFPDINKKSGGLRTNFIDILKPTTSPHPTPEQPTFDPSTFASKFEGLYENSFLDSKHLKEIILPRTTKEIRENAFKGCTALQQVILVDPYNGILGATAFEDKEGLVIYVADTATKQKFDDYYKFQHTEVRVGDPRSVVTIEETPGVSLILGEGYVEVTSQSSDKIDLGLFSLDGLMIGKAYLLPGSSHLFSGLAAGIYLLSVNQESVKLIIPQTSL